MADGATFDINVAAKGIGVDSTAEELNALADGIRVTNTVATEFDTAIAATSARLKEASAASQLAAEALNVAQSRYKELESAANKAAKEVEKATAAGKDTSALKAAADQATAAMQKQAIAVDALKTKSTSAATAEKKLADSLKTLQGQQAAATKEIAKANAPIDKVKSALDGLGYGDKAEKLKKLTAGIGGMHTAALLTAAAFAVVAVAIGAAVFGLAAFAVKSHPEAVQRLTAASQHLQQSLGKLFSGIKLDKFLAAFDDFVGIFNEGTSSASALKLLMETILQPIFDGVAKAEPLIKEMFKGMVYGALQVAIFVLKARNAFLAMLPESVRTAVQQFTKDNVNMQGAFTAGTYIMAGLAIAVGVLTVALIAMAVAELAALWPILLVVAAIALVIAAIVYWDDIIAALSETWDDFVNGVSDAVDDIIDGIVNGIKDGAGAVWTAMKNLAMGGVNAFKGALGIKSPSTVFALQGSYTAAGYVEGIEDSAPKVNSALESMVTPPDAAAPSAPASGAKSGGGRSINIQTLNVGSGEVAESNWQRLKQMLLEEFEGAALTIGGGEAPST